MEVYKRKEVCKSATPTVEAIEYDGTNVVEIQDMLNDGVSGLREGEFVIWVGNAFELTANIGDHIAKTIGEESTEGQERALVYRNGEFLDCFDKV